MSYLGNSTNSKFPLSFSFQLNPLNSTQADLTMTTPHFTPSTCQAGTVIGKSTGVHSVSMMTSANPDVDPPPFGDGRSNFNHTSVSLDHQNLFHPQMSSCSCHFSIIADSIQAGKAVQLRPSRRVENTFETQNQQCHLGSLHCLGKVAKNATIPNENICQLSSPSHFSMDAQKIFHENNSALKLHSYGCGLSHSKMRPFYVDSFIKKNDIGHHIHHQKQFVGPSGSIELRTNSPDFMPIIGGQSFSSGGEIFEHNGRWARDSLVMINVENSHQDVKTPILASQPIISNSSRNDTQNGAPHAPTYSQAPMVFMDYQSQFVVMPTPTLSPNLPSQLELDFSALTTNSSPYRSSRSSISSVSSSDMSSCSSDTSSPSRKECGYNQRGKVKSSSEISTVESTAFSPKFWSNMIHNSNSYDSHFNDTKRRRYTNIPKGPPFFCRYPHCLQGFPSQFDLESHTAAHGTHRCRECGRVFTRIHDLRRHQTKHLAKAHSCVVCKGRFARQDAVTRHLKLHDGMNKCGIVLQRLRISVKVAAAGKIARSALGSEDAIKEMIEDADKLVKRAKDSTKTLEMNRYQFYHNPRH